MEKHQIYSTRDERTGLPSDLESQKEKLDFQVFSREAQQDFPHLNRRTLHRRRRQLSILSILILATLVCCFFRIPSCDIGTCEDTVRHILRPVANPHTLLSHRLHTTTDTNPAGHPPSQLNLHPQIPQYVLDHAPLIHLYSREQFWPCDIADHLHHTTPYHDYDPLPTPRNPYNLSNLDRLNRAGSPSVYLQSDDNVEDRPEWLLGRKNIPARPDDLIEEALSSRRANSTPHPPSHDESAPRRGGRSTAPAVLLVIHKPHNITDAFYFFFYSYNLGNSVFNVRFGNHVGDWEHTLVRFQHGRPSQVFFSEHAWGEAYSFAAVEKIADRPVGYSATGTHAMYGAPGTHRYILPWGLLHDETDRGPLWDPLLNAHTYVYDVERDRLRASAMTPRSPTGWFYYRGHWGDKAYPVEDRRQYEVAGQYHYVNGPIGPRFKNLGRASVCQGGEAEACVIRERTGWDEGVLRRWEGSGPGEVDGGMGGEEDAIV